MNQDAILSEVRNWPIDDQIQLVEALWTSITAPRVDDHELNEAETEILIQRLAEDDQHPDEQVSWETVKLELLNGED